MIGDLPQRPNFAFAKRHGATLVGLDQGMAGIAFRPGTSAGTFAELRRHCGMPLHLVPYANDAYDELLQKLYGEGDETGAIAIDLNDSTAPGLAELLPEPQDLLENEDDAPIIRLLNALFTEAIKRNASDIHIEPFETRFVVRFRIDGVLAEILSPQKSIAPAVISRVKVMAHLDIAEKRLPQDGRISLRVAGRPVDVRVSTIPVGAAGERVVLRLLDKQAGRLDVDALGLPSGLRARLDGLIHRPHGIFLVTGPTGSGKTTTLYTALSRLNTPKVKIITVEDPVEYQIEGINQIQAKPAIGLDFASALRSIVRQDPDIIMIGEMRDLETARIAIQSALTGHLVLSTLHTNNAAGGITRLLDMGVEDYLLTSTINGIVAQRLVRRLEPVHAQKYPASPEEIEKFGLRRFQPQGEIFLYRAVPSALSATGYLGRTTIMELLVMDDAVRRAVMRHAGMDEIEKLARQAGMATMYEVGIAKALRGETTIEEVLRVTEDA